MFQEILNRHLSKSNKTGRVSANLSTNIEAKGLALAGTLEVRMEDEVFAEDIEDQAMLAASRRLDDILSDVVSMDVLDGRFFTSLTRTQEKGKVNVPTTVYGLRDKQGRVLSGLGLARLLNLTLFAHVQSLMGPSTLVNRTGRFAHSAHITDVLASDKVRVDPKYSVSIFFSYMLYPYEIFEKTEPWSDGGRRSPSQLIDKAIDIALRDILNPASYTGTIFKIRRNDER